MRFGRTLQTIYVQSLGNLQRFVLHWWSAQPQISHHTMRVYTVGVRCQLFNATARLPKWLCVHVLKFVCWVVAMINWDLKPCWLWIGTGKNHADSSVTKEERAYCLKALPGTPRQVLPAVILGQEHHNESRPLGIHSREWTRDPAPCRYVDVWCVKMVTSFAVTIFDWWLTDFGGGKSRVQNDSFRMTMTIDKTSDEWRNTIVEWWVIKGKNWWTRKGLTAR